MKKKDLIKLVKNPKFISGIYNYCDRWCERCQFTSRCLNFETCEGEFDTPESKDINNKAFWDKMQEVFAATAEMIKESAEEMGVDLNAIEDGEYERHRENVRKFTDEQPYTKIALEYTKIVSEWFESNKALLEQKADELMVHLEAEIPGTKPDKEAAKIRDCMDIIGWYQHQIYVKLCRATSGLFKSEVEDFEYCKEDADGSAKVAIIGIERSIAAWGGMLNCFSEQEKTILDILVKLKTLLKLVEKSFPDARAFVRPGLDE
ncbi:MAG: hypothetical protein LLF92_04300 [Planctomycetaceae bacterium]|nr:hypothetical protein [Planctomycetaceae bacterium]